MPKIFLQTLSLLPASVCRAMDIAAEAGYDGVEVFRTRRFLLWPSLDHYRRYAANLGLELHLHESIDYNEPSLLIRYYFGCYGGLVPTNATLCEQFGSATEPVVAYGYHWGEVISSCKSNWTLQTMTRHRDGNFNMTFRDFLDRVTANKIPITFDTQHILEFWNGEPGVGRLAHLDRGSLNRQLLVLFEVLHPYVREIHYNNFDPLSGDDMGRNIWPTAPHGALDLKEFSTRARQLGWDGTIVPEVHPRHFSRWPYSKENIRLAKKLCNEVADHWC